ACKSCISLINKAQREKPGAKKIQKERGRKWREENTEKIKNTYQDKKSIFSQKRKESRENLDRTYIVATIQSRTKGALKEEDMSTTLIDLQTQALILKKLIKIEIEKCLNVKEIVGSPH